MKIPEYYNPESAPIGLAAFGLAAFGRDYRPLMIGLEARKQIGRLRTFRVRHGNGKAGSVLGQKYQDEMIYYTPTNRQTPEQQAWRGIHADAIATAKALTEEQKEPYRVQARKEGRQNWLTVFVREYLLERV